MAIPVTYSLRNLWVRRSTTIATTGGIALVVFVLASSLMLASGVHQTLASSGSRDKAIVLQQSASAEALSRLPQSVVGLVAAAPGLKRAQSGSPLVSGESVVQLMVGRIEDASRIVSVQVRGVPENVLELRPEVRLVAGRRATPGTAEAMLGQKLVGRYRDLALGGELELQKGRKLAIVGVFQANGSGFESEVWADLNSVQTSTQSEGYVSSITARLASASAFEAFADALQNESKQEGLAVERESEYYERLSQGLSNMIIVLGGMVTVIFSLGAMLGAAITMYGAVEQRKKEIGVLRALGFSAGEVLLVFISEATGLALLGTVFGLALASLTPLLEFSTANAATAGVEVVFRFLPSSSILCASALTGALLGTLGGVFPAVKASRINAIDAMRA
jgi:putative ABC transport system permease protein